MIKASCHSRSLLLVIFLLKFRVLRPLLPMPHPLPSKIWDLSDRKSCGTTPSPLSCQCSRIEPFPNHQCQLPARLVVFQQSGNDGSGPWLDLRWTNSPTCDIVHKKHLLRAGWKSSTPFWDAAAHPSLWVSRSVTLSDFHFIGVSGPSEIVPKPKYVIYF